MDYLTFQQALDKYKTDKIVKSERGQVFKDLYSYYEKSYKLNTWSDYVKWLKKNKLKHSKDTIAQFDKIKYPKISVKSFCSFWLSHIPTRDLYFLLSFAKDMDNRKQNFNKWLFYSLNAKRHENIKK